MTNAHSCDSQKRQENLTVHYVNVIRLQIGTLESTIAGLLKNTNCSRLKHKAEIPDCVTEEVAGSIHNMTCMIRHVKRSLTEDLVQSVLSTLKCPCPAKRMRNKGEMKAMKVRRETKKLCKVKLILASMTKCYELLNAQAPAT